MWNNITKLEVVTYLNKRTTPKRAKELLRDCLEHIETLERANESFSQSWERLQEDMPSLVQREIERGNVSLKKSRPELGTTNE